MAQYKLQISLAVVVGLCTVNASDFQECFTLSGTDPDRILDSVKDCVEGEWDRVSDEKYVFAGKCATTMEWSDFSNGWLLYDSEEQINGIYPLGYCIDPTYTGEGPWDPTLQYARWNLLYQTPTVWLGHFDVVLSTCQTHWIAAGNPSNFKWNGMETQECAADLSVQASQGTANGADIAVSCCTEDGEAERYFDGECVQAVTYDKAVSICDLHEMRLCTLNEMVRGVTAGTGCQHDARYNWVSDQCGDSVSGHYVAQGSISWSGWGSDPDSYCQSDTDNQAAYESSNLDRDIAVSCCSLDGTTGYRPDCSAHPATYQEAVDLCSANNMRLCTLQEMVHDITKGKGCLYDTAYNWVSDECDIGTDAAASSNVYGSNEVSESEDGAKSFDDFLPMVLGASVGAVVIAVIVAFVVVTRRKNTKKPTEKELDDVVHVPDASASAVSAVSVDGDETVGQ